MRHINLQFVNIVVYHLFAELAELAYTTMRRRLVGTVLADDRTNVAKLIHALVGVVKLVLVPNALYFLAFHRNLVIVTLILSHFCCNFIDFVGIRSLFFFFFLYRL